MDKIGKFVLLSLLTTSSLLADFKTLSTEEVEESIKNKVVVIDIRRDEEFRRYGIIKGSHKLTFFDASGAYDVDKWMEKFTKIVKDKKQPFILVCAHANRTKVVGRFLDKQLNYENVQELGGGIKYGWIDKGKKTTK
jgi:rhodanese-related sulfurtransferase